MHQQANTKGGVAMKKLISIFFLCIFCALFFLFTSVPFINDQIAEGVKNDLIALPLPEKTKVMDSLSRAGKLVGSGNGMQYFGAILIQSNLTLEELQEYYMQYSKNDGTYVVKKQTGNCIEEIEHGEVNFSKWVSGVAYYIVYSWGDSDYFLRDFDLRAH